MTVCSQQKNATLLGEISEDAEWLVGMVENLLTVTRVDGAVGANLNKVPEAAEEVVAEAVSKFRKRFPERVISASVPDDLLMVPMDAMLIKQVIINLLENVAFHTPPDTRARLTVSRQGKNAQFCVSDNGAGISPERLAHIFDGMFQRDREDHADAHHSMGIGLSVCNSIVKAHGGTMEARNVPGDGAELHFGFRWRRNKNGKQIFILLVEDESNIASFITTVLRANQYEVKRAATGEEALMMASSYCPDLIILDLGLPDIDGPKALRTVRSWTQTPVIVVSARSHERDKVESLDLGADDYITKPFGTSELLARVRTALRHSQNRADINASGGVFRAGKMRIDYDKRRVTVDGADVHLTQTEYNIVALLSRHAGRVLTYDFVMRETWGPGVTGGSNQILRVNMANIRRKLEKNPAEPEYIFTETGVGYRMLDGEKE